MFHILLEAFKIPKIKESKPISEIQKKVQIRFNSGNINAQRGNVTDKKTFQKRKNKVLAFQF